MWKWLKSIFVDPSPVPPPEIKSAVWTVASHRDRPLAKEIEQAMAAAVMDYLARGGSFDDVPALRDVQLQARNRVLGRG